MGQVLIFYTFKKTGARGHQRAIPG